MKLKKSEYVILSLICAVAVVVLYYGAYMPIRTIPMGICADNLKQIMTSLQMYTATNDGKLPPAAQWRDSIFHGYTSGPDVFICPEANLDAPQRQQYAQRLQSGVKFSIPTAPDGYAFLSRLSSVNTSRLADPTKVPVLYDSNAFRPNAADDLQSIQFRHAGHNANVGYADGHIKPTTAVPELPNRLFLAPGERLLPRGAATKVP